MAKDSQTVVSTGKKFPELKPFDELMEAFVRDNKIPGASLAVAKDGRLVYARGFGYADVEKKQPVRPESLFRIASISKSFTATATLQLVEQGKLSLDTPVFDLLPHKPHLAKGDSADPRLGQVTIAHLLRHQGGWDRKETIDPLFHAIEIASVLGKPPPATQDDVIRFMMGWQLDFDPGQRYVYSNLGYCLLGRVIEQLTGRSLRRLHGERVPQAARHRVDAPRQNAPPRPRRKRGEILSQVATSSASPSPATPSARR